MRLRRGSSHLGSELVARWVLAQESKAHRGQTASPAWSGSVGNRSEGDENMKDNYKGRSMAMGYRSSRALERIPTPRVLVTSLVRSTFYAQSAVGSPTDHQRCSNSPDTGSRLNITHTLPWLLSLRLFSSSSTSAGHYFPFSLGCP